MLSIYIVVVWQTLSLFSLYSIFKNFPCFSLQGKHIGRLSHQDPGEFPEEVKTLFEKAVQYYEQNMTLMVEIGDRAAQGRACGNLGNVHYLLGNFSRAIHFHQERLKIAREFGDRAESMSLYFHEFFHISFWRAISNWQRPLKYRFLKFVKLL